MDRGVHHVLHHAPAGAEGVTALDPTGPAPETRQLRFLALLFGACAAPLAWLGQVMLSYGVTTAACYPGDHPVGQLSRGPLFAVLIVVDLFALAVCCAGAFVSWRSRNLVRPGDGRSRFLALWGVMSSLWFFVAVLFNVIASVMVPPCPG
jgi:hypothetical protein